MKRLPDGLTMIRPPAFPGSAWEPPNMYLVGEATVLLLDAGYKQDNSIGLVLAELKDRELEALVLTHGHIDHAGGAAAIKERTGCNVMVHPGELAPIARRGLSVEVGRELRGGDTIEAAGRVFTVMHTPGHTPGHVCLWVEAEGLLFSGDLVTGKGSTVIAPPEGDMKDYMESLKMIKGLPVKTLLPGHGPIPEDALARIEELIEHRELRELCIAKSLEKGPKTALELVEDMYMGLIHPALYGAAAATAIAHLSKLIGEGKVRAEPEDASMDKKKYFLDVAGPLPY